MMMDDQTWFTAQMDGSRAKYAACTGGFRADGTFAHDGRACRCGEGACIGGYWHRFTTTTTAGPFGCDSCFRCGVRPDEGAALKLTTYRDIFCPDCATR